MNDDALKKLWREQEIRPEPVGPVSDQIAEMKRKMKKFERALSWRDFREIGVCLFGVLFFGGALFRVHTGLAQAGCWILILSAIFIGFNLSYARRRAPKTEPTAPLQESIRNQIHQVEIQIRLLRSVLWWYLLPVMLGAIVFFIGCNRNLGDDVFYISIMIAMNAFLYWLNLYAVKKHLVPMKSELEALLDDSPQQQT